MNKTSYLLWSKNQHVMNGLDEIKTTQQFTLKSSHHFTVYNTEMNQCEYLYKHILENLLKMNCNNLTYW
jgi:hypothetical protein